jgi:uncharacterized protein (DUF433 family)
MVRYLRGERIVMGNDSVEQVERSDAHPGIQSEPSVCGGAATIVRTRIPVWVLEQARRLGMGEVELLRAYPSLRAEDLASAWAYVRGYREEIEREIAENEAG